MPNETTIPFERIIEGTDIPDGAEIIWMQWNVDNGLKIQWEAPEQ